MSLDTIVNVSLSESQIITLQEVLAIQIHTLTESDPLRNDDRCNELAILAMALDPCDFIQKRLSWDQIARQEAYRSARLVAGLQAFIAMIGMEDCYTILPTLHDGEFWFYLLEDGSHVATYATADEASRGV